MTATCIAFSVLAFVSLLLCLINWTVHVEITTSNTRNWGWGRRKYLVRELFSHKWEEYDRFAPSIFDHATNSMVHASIVQFDGRGMVLTPWTLLWLSLWLRKRRRPLVERVNWAAPSVTA